LQPSDFQVRVVVGGLLANLFAGRRGRATNSPPQLEHLPARTVSAHVVQKVHSNEHILASVELGGRSLLQHSQLGLSSSISMLREGGVSSINNEKLGTGISARAMWFGIVSDLIAGPGPKNENASVFKFSAKLTFDTQKDMAFDTPVIGQVARRVLDHSDPDAIEVLRLPVGNTGLTGMFGSF